MLIPACGQLPHQRDLSAETVTDASGTDSGARPRSLSETYADLVDYSDVMIVRNVNSATSMNVADYFRSQRNISWANVCNVTTATTEVISPPTFTALATQVKDCVNNLPPGTAINFLVTTKGVPLKTSRSPWENSASVDSELAIIGGPYEGGTGGYRWIANPYFRDFVPFTRSAYNFYIVTRITGYTEQEAVGLVDKATEAIGRRGRFVFDVDPGKDGSPGYKVGNDWMRAAEPILTGRGFEVRLEQTSLFLTNESKVAGYTSWGSNDGTWYTAVNSNSGFESDGDSDGVPDGWFYEDPAGTANVTMNASVVQSGSWSLRIERPSIDGNYTSVGQNFTIVPERRYFLAGSVNLSLGVSGRGLFLQVKVFDSIGNLLSLTNGSATTGTANWTGLGQVKFEPTPGASRMQVSVFFAEANGTAFIDNVRLFEIRPHNGWVLGSLAETYVSTGGRSFVYGTSYGQSLIADLIRDGVTGVKGYVYEPYLNAVAHPDVLFDAYTRGFTLAESYMMASEISLSWMDAIIGDPKLAPYNMSLVPNLAVRSDDISFSNPHPSPGEMVDFNVSVRNTGRFPARNVTLSFYQGDPRMGGSLLDNRTVTVPDGGFASASVPWTANWTSGQYSLCVFADSPDEFYESDETDNIGCNRIGITTNYTLSLAPGHRFVSVPLYPAKTDVASVLSSVSGCYDYVRWYESTMPSDPWRSFVPGRARNSMDRIDSKMGFWLNVTTACDLVIEGVPQQTTAIVLRAGWNMVGFPSFNSTYTVADLKADTGVPGLIVEAYDQSAAPYYLKRVADSHPMRAGEGYWVCSPVDAMWLVRL